MINQEFEHELYAYLFNFLKERDIYVRRIGGMPDHVHILCDIPAKHSLAGIIKVLKSESSKFMRMNRNFPYWRGWSKEYACFTVDASLRETRRQYIMNQKIHHSKVNFEDEYRQLLLENHLDINYGILGDEM